MALRLAPFFALAVACSYCTVAQQPAHTTSDCRLIARPFVVAPTLGPAAEAFGQVPEGVLLVEQYFNTESLNKTRFLDLTTYVLLVSGKRGVYRQPLETVQAEQVDRLCQDVERGAFQQACALGSSEGSRTLLLVKVHGDTILRYEAPQYDYHHLNPNEQSKISRALALIALMAHPTN